MHIKIQYDRIKTDFHKMKFIVPGIVLFYVQYNLISFSTCPMILVTGMPCPFCGMTRAGVALLKGDFLSAFYWHPMIYGIFIIMLYVIVVRYFTNSHLKYIKIFIFCFICLTCIIYIYRMYTLFPEIPPMMYYDDNLINKLYLVFVE